MRAAPRSRARPRRRRRLRRTAGVGRPGRSWRCQRRDADLRLPLTVALAPSRARIAPSIRLLAIDTRVVEESGIITEGYVPDARRELSSTCVPGESKTPIAASPAIDAWR